MIAEADLPGSTLARTHLFLQIKRAFSGIEFLEVQRLARKSKVTIQLWSNDGESMVDWLTNYD